MNASPLSDRGRSGSGTVPSVPNRAMRVCSSALAAVVACPVRDRCQPSNSRVWQAMTRASDAQPSRPVQTWHRSVDHRSFGALVYGCALHGAEKWAPATGAMRVPEVCRAVLLDAFIAHHHLCCPIACFFHLRLWSDQIEQHRDCCLAWAVGRRLEHDDSWPVPQCGTALGQ